MNYQQQGGGGGYPGPGGQGQGGYPPNFPQSGYPQQQYENYGPGGGPPMYEGGGYDPGPRMMEGGVYPQPHINPAYLQGPGRGQGGAPEQIPRDPRRPQVSAPSSSYPQGPGPGDFHQGMHGMQQQQQPVPQDRIPRNPFPGFQGQGAQGGQGFHAQQRGISGPSEEQYDPSLPTYNATPLYPSSFAQPAESGRQTIVAPSISSILQLAAEQVSKRAQEAQAAASAPPAPTPQQNQQQQDSSSGQMEIITGLVTQMQDAFGMVSGEIFFQVTTVVGARPNVGDKVVVEAERVSGMPFKFNAKRVQMLSKDLISDKEEKKESSRKNQSSKRSNEKEFSRRGEDSSMDFGPLPSMPNSLNLPKPSSSQSQGPLKSILKRNPPPPPLLSKSKSSGGGNDKYRPESPVGFKSNSSFSLDLRGDFPVIKQPTNLEQLYPELLYVNKDQQGRNKTDDRRRSPSPNYTRRVASPPKRRSSRSIDRERDSRRNKSPVKERRKLSRSPKRRSRSKTPPRRRSSASPKRNRRSRTPKRRSRSPKRRSRSPVKRSRTPDRKKHSSSRVRRSRSKSKEKARRSRSPRSSRNNRRSRSKSRSPRRNKERDAGEKGSSEPQIVFFNNGSINEEAGNIYHPRNPFGEESGIVGTVCTSSLLPRVQPEENSRFAIGGGPGFQGNLGNQMPPANKPARPLAPIRFSIAPVPAAATPLNKVYVSNPTYTPRPPAPTKQQQQRGGRSNLVYVQNPLAVQQQQLPQAVITPNAPPSAIVASVEAALKKNKKKKKESQEPAYKVLPKGQNNQNKARNTEDEVMVIGQVNRNGAGGPLSEQEKMHMWEQERLLLKQKQALDGQLNLANTQHVQQLKRNVEDKLRNLRENFEAGIRGGQSQEGDPQRKLTIHQKHEREEELERIREDIQRQKFQEEERRLKATGDKFGLEKLWKEEERRRRYVEEQRLERIRMQEIHLKKDKNWDALKKLREDVGGTAEREMELMRLKEIRKREEMEEEEEIQRTRAQEEHSRWLNEEQEVSRRAVERAQRGTEGPVRRLIMDTQVKQLKAADIEIPPGIRGERDSHLSLSPRRGRGHSPRGSRSRSRDRRRGERSLERERMHHHHRRSPSPRGDHYRGGMRPRSQSLERHRREPSREAVEMPKWELREDVRERELRRGEVQFIHEAPTMSDFERAQHEQMMSQMEIMREQEAEIRRREQEVFERMAMVERAYYPPQQHIQDPGMVRRDRYPSPDRRRY